MDKRPMAERAPEFRAALIELCKRYRIEVIATLAPMPSSIIAQIRFVDVNDPAEMKKYGLEEINQGNEPSSILAN